MSAIYTDHTGQRWSFNDCVNATFTFLPEEQTVGRLVQVRKGVGQFGSDLYFLRRADGSLMTFENVMLRPYKGHIPLGPDKPDDAYTIKDKWEESGFIVEHPKQPASPVQSFAMMITTATPAEGKAAL